MEQIISKEKFDELVSVKGETRGLLLKSGIEFILQKEGEAGLKKLEDTLAILNYPLKYKEIKTMKFYPLGAISLLLVLVKKLFNFDDEEFKDMGKFIARFPLLVRRFIMGHSFPLEIVTKQASKAWRKYYTTGDFKTIELNKEERRVIYRIENFLPDHLFCKVLEGFLCIPNQMVVKKPTTCEEIKCPHRGDKYHEFLLRW